MISDRNKLLVFEDFRVDRTLPKYQQKPKSNTLDLRKQSKSGDNDEMMSDEDIGNTQFQVSQDIVWAEGETFNIVPMDPNGFAGGGPSRRSALRRFFAWIMSLFSEAMPLQLPQPTLTIQEFFGSVKNTAQELVIVKERADGYEQALLNAKRAGQHALCEQLEAGINAFKMETQLLAQGLPKYIDEADIVSFVKQAKRGLRLDYVRNFARVIPQAIVDTKAKLDAIGVFDAYVVLHYDPDAKSYAETQRERAARKDPILFGLMKGKRRLYFVGDWVDELCDLTLDQIAETLGADVVKSVGDA